MEEIFNSSKLDISVPEEVLDFPSEDWVHTLSRVKQRDKAFFDERLLLFFIVKIPHPTAEAVDTSLPPPELVLFLSHLQITLDAKYIATQHRGVAPQASRGINLAPPPRSHSHQNLPHSPQDHPSIFPPHTPHPTPQTDESDRKYANSSSSTEGTVLESYVWGENPRDEPDGNNFALMWSTSENAWLAVYRLTLGVSFLRTNVSEPLLSLTVSATLREKPLPVTPERKLLAALVSAAGGDSSTNNLTDATANGVTKPGEREDELCGLEEVNLLDGLSQGPTFGRRGVPPLMLPSTRLGTSLRRSAFSLPPTEPTSPMHPPPSSASAITISRSTAPILRKSFLKTLQTVSGFQIRMKSVFVPYVVIPGNAEDEGERCEAGSEERTVVLSVELGNGSTFGGPGATGFAVESVDVTVGGEGAKATLIAWGEGGFQDGDALFPLLMGPAEQFNLLYAITFLRQSEADDIADTLRNDANWGKLASPVGRDLQRPVTIIIRGRPFDFFASTSTSLDDPNNLAYPTQTFRSRWNCTLDLSSAGHPETIDVSPDPTPIRDALPLPASPFPATTTSPMTARFHNDKTATIAQTLAVAGSKRHTIGGLTDRGQSMVAAGRYRPSTSIFNNVPKSYEGAISTAATSPSAAGGRFTPRPPSTIVTAPARFASPLAVGLSVPSPGIDPPPTPAYPAYPPEAVPQTPAAQSPFSNFRGGGDTGLAMEPRRERMMQTGTPQTAGPRMTGASFTDRMAFDGTEDRGAPVVVSVGLMPTGNVPASDLLMIHPLDTFGIDIFVFNRSERTRRFEVSYPAKKRRRQQMQTIETYPTNDIPKHLNPRQAPGILPLENRIRVGPLRPHTCQSVRMQFLALQPGVHSIHALILMDVETGYSMNLKSVMDIVVHEVGVSY